MAIGTVTKKLENRISFDLAGIEEDIEKTINFNIFEVPTLIFIKNNQEV
ncbi:hypothetical protein [Aquimarina atlantica]|nr:hypothetical protein [Aquimarina atlantica]